MYLKCKTCILFVNLKHPGIRTHLILVKFTWYQCVLVYVNEDKLLFLILLQDKWNYATPSKKLHLTSICTMMLSQEIKDIPHNKSFKMFFLFYMLVVRSIRTLFIRNDYVNLSTYLGSSLSFWMYQKEHSYTNIQRKQSWTFDPHFSWRKPTVYRIIQKFNVIWPNQ